MAGLEDVKNWYERDLGRFASWNKHVELGGCDAGSGETTTYRIRLYTEVNRYTITVRGPGPRPGPMSFLPGDMAKEPNRGSQAIEIDNGYLGCIATCRKARAGEDWQRGNDLADGPLTEETWRRIIADIVSYELARVHTKADAEKAAGIKAA